MLSVCFFKVYYHDEVLAVEAVDSFDTASQGQDAV